MVRAGPEQRVPIVPIRERSIDALMATYLVSRLLLAVPTALGAVTLVFVVVRLLPGDAALLQVVGTLATGSDLAQLRHQLGLDQPVPIQYLGFLFGLIHGDLGVSMFTHEPVLAAIIERLPYTMELAAISIALAVGAGIPLGVLAAVRHGSWLDALVSASAVLGVSIPVYWLGLMLMILLSINVHLLPAGGTRGAFSWVLPSVALSTVSLGVIARMTRAALLETLGLDYIRTARAKGLSYAKVVRRHALRNALLPVLTVVGLQFGHLLGGAVLTETVFSWPGIGRLLVDSILSRDYPITQGIMLIFALMFILVNVLVDIGYAYVDPRIRY